MAKDMNKKAFDDATKLKLDIFGECFEEWLPVFNNNRWTDSVYVFDFFAGSGRDSENNPGSPLVLLDKAKGKKCKYCLKAKKNITFIFNESKKTKSRELEKNIEEHIENCKNKNKCIECTYHYTIENDDFKNIFSNSSVNNILNNQRIGKFILLDQYGFKEINEAVFQQLISFPKTDFIFFISSSFINRFKTHPNTIKYIDTSKISFEDIKPNEIHRAIADYFRDLIPEGKEYYLHHFTIKKGANYWGLILGSNHTLGMEKFLKVCWKYDELSGEANYNIDDNWEKDTLFGFSNPESNVKKDLMKEKIEEDILSGKIKNNLDGFKYTMLKGCEPKLFTEVVIQLEKDKQITREGDLNYTSSNIHRAKEYKIKRLDDGT